MWIVLFASNQNNLRENIGLASFAQKIGKGGWGTSQIKKKHMLQP